MLTISHGQRTLFDEAVWRRFEDQMVAHSRTFSPRLCEILGEAQLRVAVRGAIARARAHGFELTGPIRLCVELMFLRGSRFDTDPQYPALEAILESPRGEMERAAALYEATLDYQERVSGPGNENVRHALERLYALTQAPIEIAADEFGDRAIALLAATFPEKAAYVGRPALAALVDEARAAAGAAGLPSTRGEVLILSLMFAFGHGCPQDPLYPWIGNTLRDPRIVDGPARERRLEKKARTWLRHVLARSPERES